MQKKPFFIFSMVVCLILATTTSGAVVSANPKTTVKQTPTTAKKNKPSKPKAKTSKKKKKVDLVQLDFTDVEIKEVVKAISKMTNKSFVYDETLRGKITIISPKPISVSDAYQVFISALEMKGYATVPKGKLIKIVPLREIQSQPIPFRSN